MAISNSNSEGICLPCPVTGGVSTRMTQQSFVVACGAKRSRRTTNCWGHDVAKEVFPRRCDWCKGKIECWPDELVLADVVKTKVEDKNNMTTVAGCVCDVCGKPANNKKNKSRGMTLCSSCKGIVPCVDRLDVVVAMMQRTGKAEELLNKLRPHDDDALEVSEAIYALDHHDDNKSYRLEQEVHRLKRENEYLAQQIKCRSPYDEALLEWARKRYEAGEIKLKVTVEAEDENN